MAAFNFDTIVDTNLGELKIKHFASNKVIMLCNTYLLLLWIEDMYNEYLLHALCRFLYLENNYYKHTLLIHVLI